MIFFNRVWIFGYFFLLAGCVSLSKQEQTEHVLAPPSMESTLNESLATGVFAMGDWPDKNWWEVFQSDQLNSLINEVLVANPSIRAIEKQIAFAKQAAVIVRSNLFPLVFFDAKDTWQYLSQNGLYRAFNPDLNLNANLVDLTLSFTYEFDFWGKNRNLFEAAIGKAKEQEAEAEQVKLVITTAIAQTYFALKTNLVRKKLYETLLQVRRGSFQLQQLLEEHSLSSKLEPLQLEEDVFETEKELLAIEEEIAANKHFINMLRGKGPDEVLEVNDLLPSLANHISLPENLSIDLLARRPDLMAQIWKAEAIAHEVGAAKADFLPNVNLTALLGLESTSYALLFNGSSGTVGATPAIHLPIFTAGAIRANVRAKKALFDQAIYEYNDLILKSIQEVADLIVLATSVFEQKQKQDKIVADAILRYELITLRHQNGLDSLFANYAKEQEVIQKKIKNIELIYGQYLACIKLIKALGGGYYYTTSIPIQKEAINAKKESDNGRS
ncbi:MAG: efflux transporter outer membrane subunit [Chlamydiales bacterium]|nr:efflux transporter outer membrane subunit [Chlamydiales bacterium]